MKFQTEISMITRALVPVLEALHARAGDSIRDAGHFFEARVGSGHSTNHQFKTAKKLHCITIGQKMVAEKAYRTTAEGWLSAREIKRHRFYGGTLSRVTLLAHTLLHEYAHALQTHAGERLRGSVHNAAFYRILHQLHAEHGAYVLDCVRKAFNRHQASEDFLSSPGLIETPPPGRSFANRQQPAANPRSDNDDAKRRFRIGDPVSFTFRGQTHRGQITKKNAVRASVETPIGTILVPYSKLTPRTGAGFEQRTPDLPANDDKFNVDQPVSFKHKGQVYTGRIKRCNQKTATIVETDVMPGREWRVSYGLLKAC